MEFDAPSGSNEPVPFKPRNLFSGYVNPWTPEKIDRLRELAALGWTHKQMAADLGMTRNATIGKVHREGIELTHTNTGGNPHNLRPQAPRKPKPKYSPETRRTRAVEKTITRGQAISMEPPEMGVLDIMQLESHHCRFPVDGGGLFFYCGVPHGDNAKPYCRFHRGIMYRPEHASGWARPDNYKRKFPKVAVLADFGEKAA